MTNRLHHLRRRTVLPALGLALALGVLGLVSPGTPTAHAATDCTIKTAGGYDITIKHGDKVYMDGKPFTCLDGSLWADTQWHGPDGKVLGTPGSWASPGGATFHGPTLSGGVLSQR